MGHNFTVNMYEEYKNFVIFGSSCILRFYRFPKLYYNKLKPIVGRDVSRKLLKTYSGVGKQFK